MSDQPQPEFISKDEFTKTLQAVKGEFSRKLEALTSKMPTLDTFAELGLLEKDEAGSYKPRQSGQQTKKTEPSDLEKQVADLRKAITARDEALAKADQDRQTLELKTAVINALGKAGAVNPDRDHVHVISNIKKADSGYVAKAKDQYGTETDVPLESFVNDWLKSNPELKKASGLPGSGVPAGLNGKSMGSVDVSKMSMEQYVQWRKAQKTA